MKALIIVNTSSGRGRPESKLSQIMAELITKYSDIVICRTYHKPDAYEYTSHNLINCDLVIVIGGDGTVSDVVNAIADSQYNPTVAIIPTGTCNDVAHSLGLNGNITQLSQLLAANSYIYHDIIQINNRYAVYGVAWGKFASTSFNTSQRSKKYIGRLSYLLNAAKDLTSDWSMCSKLTIDNQSIDSKYCLALLVNSRYVAGFEIDRYANVSDGKITLTLVPAIGKLADAKNIASIFVKGISNTKSQSNTISLRQLSTHFGTPINIVIDGEKYISDHINISIVPKRIKFLSKK